MKKLTLTPWTIFALVLVFLVFIAVILWLVLTPKVIEPTSPPPVPKVPEVVTPPPPPSLPPPPVKAVGEVKPPKLIKKVDPVYPEEARQAKVEGVVILECTTDAYGSVTNVKVLRSVPALDQAAIDAVKQWVYEPMIIDGKPRGVIFTVTVRFQLK